MELNTYNKKNRLIIRRNGKPALTQPFKWFLLVLPCVIFVFIFNYLPLWGWSYSFYNYKPGIPLRNSLFVGFDHYTRLFTNPVLRRDLFNSLRNTFAMAGIGMCLRPVPMLFAIMLHEIRSSKFRKIIQTITTMPNFISWVILYSIAFFMFSVNQGVVNKALVEIGVLSEPKAFLSMNSASNWIFMESLSLWKGLGWSSIIYLASIAGIDAELFEAAVVDGTSRIQRIWYITIPSLLPTFFVLLVLSIGNILNSGLDMYYVFQNPLNLNYIQVLDLYVYNQGIGSGQISYATAVGIMKSIVAVTLFAFANWTSKKIRGQSVF